MIKIFIVDDHPLFINGMKSIFKNNAGNIRLQGSANCAKRACKLQIPIPLTPLNRIYMSRLRVVSLAVLCILRTANRKIFCTRISLKLFFYDFQSLLFLSVNDQANDIGSSFKLIALLIFSVPYNGSFAA